MKPTRVPKGEYSNRHTKTDTGGMVLTPVSMKTAKKHPCVECPLRRDSAPGYLGGYSPEMYVEVLHSPASLACHSSPGFHEGDIARQHHCTGVAAFRANVRHRCTVHGRTAAAQESTDFVGEDFEHYFGSDEEFVAHHRPGQKK